MRLIAFEWCAAFPVDDLNGDFTVRRRDRADGHAQRHPENARSRCSSRRTPPSSDASRCPAGATAWTSAKWSALVPGQTASPSLPEATTVPAWSRTTKLRLARLQPHEHFMPTWNLKASPAVIAEGTSQALR